MEEMNRLFIRLIQGQRRAGIPETPVFIHFTVAVGDYQAVASSRQGHVPDRALLITGSAPQISPQVAQGVGHLALRAIVTIADDQTPVLVPQHMLDLRSTYRRQSGIGDKDNRPLA